MLHDYVFGRSEYITLKISSFVLQKKWRKKLKTYENWEGRNNKPEILSAWKAWVKFFNTSNFPIISQVTQIVQSTSHPSCPMSKFPKLSKLKSPKAQVTQSSSRPKLKSPKVQVAQIAKSANCKQVKNLSHGQEYLWPCNSQKYF